MLLSDDARIEDAGSRGQRIDRWVDAFRHDRALKRKGRVQMREYRGGRRVRIVVCWHVDGLERRDGTLVRGRDPLFELAHVGTERRLISNRRGHAAKKDGNLRRGLREAEDIVDE